MHERQNAVLCEQEPKRSSRIHRRIKPVTDKSVVNAALESYRRRSNTGNPEHFVRLKQANDAGK